MKGVSEDSGGGGAGVLGISRDSMWTRWSHSKPFNLFRRVRMGKTELSTRPLTRARIVYTYAEWKREKERHPVWRPASRRCQHKTRNVYGGVGVPR